MLKEQDRKLLIDLCIKGERNLKTSDVEFRLPKPSYTIDTLDYLKKRHPKHQFSIIMGSDNFKTIKLWKAYEILLKTYQIYIYERPGFKPVVKPRINIILIKAPLLEISSTHVRELIKAKKSIRYLVPDIIKEEIERKKFYT